jgi:hypothetical protein
MNENIKNFRNEIAKLEKEQKELKPQRKTVYGPKDATVSPWEATESVRENKVKLRCMYAAYGLMRGKSFSTIESAAKPLNRADYYEHHGTSVPAEYEGKHPLYMYVDRINDYLKAYGYEIPYEEKKTYWGTQKFYKADEEVICLSEQQA